MSFSIVIYGGVFIMMGHTIGSESLFYYFQIEDHVPANHSLRLVDRNAGTAYASPRTRGQPTAR
jgi:hypothetical protein